VDLDGDGQSDLLSGSWPGEIFLFRGMAGHSFAAPEMLKDKGGEIINIGGGIGEYRQGIGILVRGTVEWETVDGRTFVTYRGQRIESTPEKPVATTGTASVVSAADWDGDGDYDLIVGNIDGKVYLVPNEGTSKSYAFGKEVPLSAGGQPIDVRSRAGPCVADWDGDGDLDLLVGADDGSVSLYRNEGSKTAAKLAAPVQLVRPGQAFYGGQAPKEVSRGTRSKICVVDWNGDSRPDLLVGDLAYLKPNRPEPTPEEKARHEQIRKELEPLRARYGELSRKLYSPSPGRTKEEHDKLNEDMKQVMDQIRPLQSQLPREYETHGWVWLFLRK
jgi:hypothetical protein